MHQNRIQKPLSRPFAQAIVIAVLAFAGGMSAALAHCEIPCGIYGDRMRVEQLREHFTTIEKSINKVVELGEATEDKNFNQLVRWVNNKELHANKVQEIVYQYFMNQRIKPTNKGEDEYDEYVQQLTLLHRMLVSAMKCKQTTDLQHVKELRQAVDQFEEAYFDEEDDAHMKEHHGGEHKH
ncbi:MAG: superoxide dismutase [Ni] [Verrucomicrobiota bacterium]